MVDITVLESRLPFGTLERFLPVGGDTRVEHEAARAPGEPGGGTEGNAIAGLLALVGLVALTWYLKGSRRRDNR